MSRELNVPAQQTAQTQALQAIAAPRDSRYTPPVDRIGPLTTQALVSTGSDAELIDILPVGDQGGGYTREGFDWPVVYEVDIPVQDGDVLKVWASTMVTTERMRLVSVLSYLSVIQPGMPGEQMFANKEGVNVRQGEGHHAILSRFQLVEVIGDGTVTVQMRLGAFDYGINGFPHHLDIGADDAPSQRSYGRMIVEVLR